MSIVDACSKGGSSGLVLVLGAVFADPGLFVAEVVFGFFAGEGEGVSIFEVEGGQLELMLALPGSKPDDVL